MAFVFIKSKFVLTPPALTTSLMKKRTVPDQFLWAHYKSAICKAAGLKDSSDENYTSLGHSLFANLAAFSKALPPMAVPTITEALAQVYLLADTLITPNEIYTPALNRFFSQYATYIDCLIPEKHGQGPTPGQEAEIRLLQSAIKEANDKYNHDFNEALASWHLQGQEFPNKYPYFQNFIDETFWGEKLINENSIILGLNSQINNLLSEIFGKDFEAIMVNKQIVDTVRTSMQGFFIANTYTMQVSTDAGNAIKPTYTPSNLVTFSEWVDATIRNHYLADRQKNKKPISFFLPKKNKPTEYANKNIDKPTGSIDAFFYTGKRTAFRSKSNSQFQSGQLININTEHEDFSAQFQYEAITNVQLTPGLWYDSSLMYNFQNPNHLSKAISLTIAMYPDVNLTLDSKSFYEFIRAYHSKAGFGVGPYWASATHKSSKSSPQMEVTWNENLNMVQMKSSSPIPLIIGMEMEIL